VGLTTAEETAERLASAEPARVVPRPLPPPPTSSTGPAPAAGLPPVPPLPRPPPAGARGGAPTTAQRPSRRGLDADLGRTIDAALDDEERAFDGGVTFDDLDELDVASPVVALTDVRKPGDPLDATAELATRKHPRLSAHDLGLLELDILVADPEPPATAPSSEKRTSPLPAALIVDEPEPLPPPPAVTHGPAEACIGLDPPDTALDAPALSAPEIAIVYDDEPAARVTDVIAAAAPADDGEQAAPAELTGEPEPLSASDLEPVSAADLAPLPGSEGEPVAVADAEPEPAIAPDPVAAAVPAPGSELEPEPQPELEPGPETASGSRPVPIPALEADPGPRPAHEPVSSSAAVGGSEITSVPGGASEDHRAADAPVGAESLSGASIELPLPPSDFDDDEPTQPPAADADPPERLHAALLRARAGTTGRAPRLDGAGEGTRGGPEGTRAGEGGTFAGGFTGTLAELAPDGTALEGPLGVFSILPLEAADELARRAVVKLFDPGEVVVREGDVGDACYVIARGEVVVTRQGAEGEPPIELARLGEGALFGEFAILADRRRHATVTTLGEAEIYLVPRLLLRELAAIYPDVGPALERFYRERLLANLLQTSPLFARLAVDERAGLLASFEPMRVESGKAIVRQGERAGGLFLIVLGAVEVVCRTDDRRAVVLATLGEGAYVGEISLLTGDVATASVVACGPVELAALPATAFYRIVSDYPELWAAMRDEAAARRLHTARVLAGRTAVV
jgi:CRP-like cAMP-binding protein